MKGNERSNFSAPCRVCGRGQGQSERPFCVNSCTCHTVHPRHPDRHVVSLITPLVIVCVLLFVPCRCCGSWLFIVNPIPRETFLQYLNCSHLTVVAQLFCFVKGSCASSACQSHVYCVWYQTLLSCHHICVGILFPPFIFLSVYLCWWAKEACHLSIIPLLYSNLRECPFCSIQIVQTSRTFPQSFSHGLSRGTQLARYFVRDVGLMWWL